jgi:hypothetical protein
MKATFYLAPILAGAILATSTPATSQDVWNTLPGEFAFRTLKGFYVTAIGGGGRTTEPMVVTAATSAGAWEKFRLSVMDPPPPNDKSIQTSGGRYLTAVSGGGRTSDVLHTDATQVRDWEKFRVSTHSRPTPFCVGRDSGRNPLGMLERAMGIEPTTRSLGSYCSTTELHPPRQGRLAWREGAL